MRGGSETQRVESLDCCCTGSGAAGCGGVKQKPREPADGNQKRRLPNQTSLPQEILVFVPPAANRLPCCPHAPRAHLTTAAAWFRCHVPLLRGLPASSFQPGSM